MFASRVVSVNMNVEPIPESTGIGLLREAPAGPGPKARREGREACSRAPPTSTARVSCFGMIHA
jgi:hypothetical protein